MAKKKTVTEEIKKPEQSLVIPEEINIQTFEEEQESIQAYIEKNYQPWLVAKLKRICYEVSEVGLSIEEACTFSNYPHKELQTLMAGDPTIVRLMDLKNLQYERDLMKTISAKAKTDDKLAQWLLMIRNPKKYNQKKGTGGDGDDGDGSALGAVVDFVRKTGDRNGLVSETSGRAVVVKKGNENRDIIRDINEILR